MSSDQYDKRDIEMQLRKTRLHLDAALSRLVRTDECRACSTCGRTDSAMMVQGRERDLLRDIAQDLYSALVEVRAKHYSKAGVNSPSSVGFQETKRYEDLPNYLKEIFDPEEEKV